MNRPTAGGGWPRILLLLPAAAVIATLGLAAASALTPTDLAPGLAAITADELRRHVATLSADDFQGRFPCTEGERKTLAYLEGEYRALGLEPLAGDSYRQPVPLVRKTVLPTPTLTLKRRGGGKSAPPTLAWGPDFVLGSGQAIEHVAIDGAPVVFAGYGISAPEVGWDDYAGLDVTDRIVIVLGGDPGIDPPDSTLFGGRALTNYGMSLTKQEMAARHGAKGLLTIHDPARVGYPFNLMTAMAGRPRYELVPTPNTPPRPLVIGALRKEVAAAILKSAGVDLATLEPAAGRRGFRALPLPLVMSVDANLKLERSVSNNLVGRLRGAVRPDEAILLTAHWDHVGIGAPVNGDSIYNGAVDNATGTAALLAVAKAFRALPHPPDRSIVFLATTAEEQGLLGSYHYADDPLVPLASTVAEINMDALFPFGPVDGMAVTGYGKSELEDWLADAARAEGRVLVPDDQPEQGAYYRSDHYPLARKGVPAIFAVGNPAHPEADTTLMARFTDYALNSYHKPKDELTDAWDFGGIIQDARTCFRVAAALAMSDAWPNWRVGDEFRPLRDAMRRGGAAGASGAGAVKN